MNIKDYRSWLWSSGENKDDKQLVSYRKYHYWRGFGVGVIASVLVWIVVANIIIAIN